MEQRSWVASLLVDFVGVVGRSGCEYHSLHSLYLLLENLSANREPG